MVGWVLSCLGVFPKREFFPIFRLRLPPAHGPGGFRYHN